MLSLSRMLRYASRCSVFSWWYMRSSSSHSVHCMKRCKPKWHERCCCRNQGHMRSSSSHSMHCMASQGQVVGQNRGPFSKAWLPLAAISKRPCLPRKMLRSSAAPTSHTHGASFPHGMPGGTACQLALHARFHSLHRTWMTRSDRGGRMRLGSPSTEPRLV